MKAEQLESLNCGDLIKLKSNVYWYNIKRWDGILERISIVLEYKSLHSGILVDASTIKAWELPARLNDMFLLKLLIDGSVQWVRATYDEIEII